MSDQPATIGAKFAVVGPLGKGGMGTVYEAISGDTGQRVAVKVIAGNMADDPSMVARFQREVRTASALDTPHIVKVVDAGIDAISQLPYMAMELLDGEDLRQLLKRLGPLPPELALRVTAQACRALEAAHAARILHRDIKPANLFLTKEGSRRVVKLLDFGVAKVQHGELEGDAELTGLTRTGSMIGSPLYMSPEQARGNRDLDGRSDIWSLGVVLYQMLSGRTPHKKIDQLGELLVRIVTQPPPPIQRRAPWVPPAVAGLLTHALAMDANDRFPTATALREAIAMLLPEGDEIREEALRPLSEDEKEIIAESSQVTHLAGAVRGRLDSLGMSGANRSSTSPAVFAMPGEGAGDPGGGDSASGTGRVTGQLRSSTLTSGATSLSEHTAVAVPPDKKGVRIAAVALIAGSMAAAVYFGLARPPASGQEGAPAAEGARPRTVKLVVLPRDAKVEVAGAAVDAADGVVEITGALGSVHKVRVSAGGESRQVEVAVTDNGPVPAKVELELKARPAVPASSPAPEAVAPATATATAQPVIQPGPAAPWPKSTTTTAAPAPTPTGRTLRDDR